MLRRGKTAEVRFNLLARGWLAYPVTPMHTQLPPKCGCRKMLRGENRRRAVSYASTGLARLPRDIDSARNYRRRAVVEIPSPHRHRRGATALFRNPVRGAKRMRAGILRSFSSRVPEVRHYLWRDG